MPVPGDVHSALFEAGIIPDPYHGKNEEVVQWVAHRDWMLERSFTVPDSAGTWYLDLDYVDTIAEVFVNGDERAAGGQLLPPLPAGCQSGADARREPDPHRLSLQHCRRARRGMRRCPSMCPGWR